MTAKIISIINQKGGVEKTTTATGRLHVGKGVSFIDMDNCAA